MHTATVYFNRKKFPDEPGCLLLRLTRVQEDRSWHTIGACNHWPICSNFVRPFLVSMIWVVFVLFTFAFLLVGNLCKTKVAYQFTLLNKAFRVIFLTHMWTEKFVIAVIYLFSCFGFPCFSISGTLCQLQPHKSGQIKLTTFYCLWATNSKTWLFWAQH